MQKKSIAIVHISQVNSATDSSREFLHHGRVIRNVVFSPFSVAVSEDHKRKYFPGRAYTVNVNECETVLTV